MKRPESISKNFIVIQAIFISSIVLIFGISLYFFSQIKDNFESFKEKELKYLAHTSYIYTQISEYKTLTLINSLRRGSDYIENQKVNTKVQDIKNSIKRLQSFSNELNNKELEKIAINIYDEFDKFYKIAKNMPSDFKKSFEDGIDALSAIDYLNKNLSTYLKDYEKKIITNINNKSTQIDTDIKEATIVMFIILVASIVLSVFVYLRSLKLQKINKMLDNLVELKTIDLNRHVHILSHYNKAIDNSVMLIRVDKSANITSINDKSINFLHYLKSEIINKPFVNLLLNKEEIKFDTSTYNGTLEFVSKSGKILFFQTTINPILDHNGNVEEYLVFMQDITSIEENRISELTDSIYSAISIKNDELVKDIPLASIIIDEKSHILAYNKKFENIFDELSDKKEFNNFEELVHKDNSECINLDVYLDWKFQLSEENDKKICINTSKDKKIFFINIQEISNQKGMYIITLF